MRVESWEVQPVPLRVLRSFSLDQVITAIFIVQKTKYTNSYLIYRKNSFEDFKFSNFFKTQESKKLHLHGFRLESIVALILKFNSFKIKNSNLKTNYLLLAFQDYFCHASILLKITWERIARNWIRSLHLYLVELFSLEQFLYPSLKQLHQTWRVLLSRNVFGNSKYSSTNEKLFPENQNPEGQLPESHAFDKITFIVRE